MVRERTSARIGTLYFKYGDPNVRVTTEQRTVEHETIDDTVIIQTLGRRADQITVDGVVADYETDLVDDLTKQGVISLRTDRWSGDVVVKSTETQFMRAIDGQEDWLYQVTMTCLEVREFEGVGVELDPDAQAFGGQTFREETDNLSEEVEDAFEDIDLGDSDEEDDETDFVDLIPDN